MLQRSAANLHIAAQSDTLIRIGNGRYAPLDKAVQKVGQSVKIHCLI